MIQLTGPEKATLEDYLDELPAAVRSKGRFFALSGMVAHLRRLDGEDAVETFGGVVRDRQPRAAVLELGFDSVVGTCECRDRIDCAHCAGVATALLTFSESSAVAAKPEPQIAKPAGPPAPKPPSPAKILEDTLSKGLGRETRPAETAFVRDVARLFESSRRSRSVSLLELSQLTRNFSERYISLFESVHPWPEYPDSIIDFWNGLAHEAGKRGLAIPDFMAAVTRAVPPSEALRKHWRAEEVERWQKRLELSQHQLVEQAELQSAPPELDFRLVLREGGAAVESRPAGTGEWSSMKKGYLRETAVSYLENPFPVFPGAETLWDLLVRRIGLVLAAGYSSDAEKAILDAVPEVFARPALRDRVVNDEGRPFDWPDAGLAWKVTPPEAAEGNYRFDLVRPDGLPLGPVLMQVTGRRTWLVTPDAVWVSPPIPRDFSIAESTSIPADAIESLPGLSLIGRMKADLPERLRERILHVDLVPVIAAAVEKDGATAEQVVLTLTARAPDGAVMERYTLDSWIEVRAFNAAEKRVVIVNRTALDAAPDHLLRLNARRHPAGTDWILRLTRNFPEQFVAWAKSLPPSIRLELDPALRTLLDDPVTAEFGLTLEPAGTDWFDLAVQVDVGDLELSPEELRLLLNARGGYVRLGAKGWRRLEYAVSEEDEQQLARIGLDPRDLTGEKQRLHALQLADEATTRFLPEREAEAIRRRAGEIKACVTPPVPPEIRAELRPYQVEGYHFLAYLAENRFGGVLADDMGLGKTLQTLAWMAWLRSRSLDARKGKFLIVCPKSVAPNWQSEAARFLPKWRVHVWRGDTAVSLKTAIQVADALVLNYAQMRRLPEEVSGVQWAAVVLDEAQAIKNPDSQTAQAARQLIADHRLALTGTPIENRLLDLWSIFAFAMPGVLGTRAQFGRSFASAEDPLARRRLAARVRPFLLRRTKSQVARDLPDRVEEDLSCEMEGVQARLYAAEFKKARALLLKVQTKSDLDQFRFHFLTSLLRLRQICCHPALVDATQRKAESAKLEALFDLLEPLIEEGQKVLVFSQFVTMLDLLREETVARGWKTFYLAGDTEDRATPVSQFQSHEGGAVFLISIKAGGFGLNLTAASYVVLFDPWWNPAVEAQAIDRTHRIGQTQKVIAYRLISKGTIEEKIRALQHQKKAVAEDILGEERFSQSLTVDDLRFLFAEPAEPIAG